MNPGLISCFALRGLIVAAQASKDPAVYTALRNGNLAALAQALKLRAIHIAERDTQVPTIPRKLDTFYNTWSCVGFYTESTDPAQLGWGTNECPLPEESYL